ncbi:MAG: hypothetical protein HDR08_12255 [Lachnospiraceae bacterium]|nr:hypothetical protein [Lachnospiraceae bacterium]
MFREMRRGKQALRTAACEEVLKRGTAGVLAVAGDDDYPYAVPLSYVYDAGRQVIYFHSALSGHKLDAVQRNSKVSFCVVDKDNVMPKEYTTYFRSVIVFGTIRILEDSGEKYHAIEALALKYAPDDSREGRDGVIGDGTRFCMLELKIEHMSGKEARELSRHKLDIAADKWKLRDIACLYEKESRAVYSASAAEWGNVIIKISEDKKELKSGFDMLKALDGAGCCKAYEFAADLGVAVIEQISPGSLLREEQNPERRVEAFYGVFQTIHKNGADCEGHETYMDWLERAEQFCKDSCVKEEISQKMHRAYQIGKEMFAKYPERVLLHGDLHHDNILLGSDGYCMIDPKGIVGPEIFDIPRFLLNEFGCVSSKEITSYEIKVHLQRMLKLLAEKTGYCVEDMEKLLFMEGILDAVWCVEDGEYAEEVLSSLNCFFGEVLP